ncbi:hypothetical protein F2Q69_00029352 [Brassica cretica]|uniref:Uncharacterized protein n=1 Tax=Brassica cretica TaxID=69181 RepID=A0A8S9RUS0_BRACR|nr:hypothetical protein F2Q69_00029352 [Brassica cretica]
MAVDRWYFVKPQEPPRSSVEQLGEYKTVTSTTEIASTKETLASLAVLCFCSENTSQPQPSSIFKPPYLSSSWCLTVIESGLSGSQLDSILLIVSQLKLPRCDSSSS